MIYEEWGFNDHPFTPQSLPPTQLGKRLLIGRAKELKSLTRNVETSTKLATVEGLNGIGKTSVVNVAAYDLYRTHIDDGKGRLFIPCRRTFQLGLQTSLSDFSAHVFMEVAQTLIERARDLKAPGNWAETAHVDRWLNSPQSATFSAQIGGFGGGTSVKWNTTVGFEQSGFRKQVTEWLQQIFPTQRDGGVICVIDNLELLRESDRVKSVLEELRDDLFSVPGLKWVLCGALGIVRGAASSPRLNSYLHRPLEVGEIEGGYTSDLLQSRKDAFGIPGQQVYLPLDNAEFELLYRVMRGNLRDILANADTYCQRVVDYPLPQTPEEKVQLFEQWMNEEGDETMKVFRADLQPRSINVFRTACTLGAFSPSDFAKFNANSAQALRPHIKALEGVGVVVSVQDEDDQRRRTIQVTPKGWLVARRMSASG